MKVALDERSLNYVSDHLERVADPLLRQLIWQSLWNMVRDQQLRSTDYLPLAAAKVTTEADTELIETILATVTASIARYVPEERRDEQAQRFSEVAWEALQAAPAGDRQIIWARTLIGIAITPPDIERVIRLADGELTVPGLNVDQEMRWGIAARAVANGIEGAAERVAVERERDPSDRGDRAAIRAQVAEPSEQVKAAALGSRPRQGLRLAAPHRRGHGRLPLARAARAARPLGLGVLRARAHDLRAAPERVRPRLLRQPLPALPHRAGRARPLGAHCSRSSTSGCRCSRARCARPTTTSSARSAAGPSPRRDRS